MRTFWTAVAGLCVLLAAGCGGAVSKDSAIASPAPPAITSPDGSTSSPDQPVGVPASSEPAPKPPAPIKPVGKTKDPHRIKWQKAEPLEGGRAIRVTWMSGVAPCTLLDRIDVAETDSTVKITVWEGGDPSGREIACIAIAEEKNAVVKLANPLGNRKIVQP